MLGSAQPKKDGVCGMGEGLSVGTMSFQLSPQSHKTYSLCTWLLSALPSLHKSPGCVAANEILCAGPLREYLHFQQIPLSAWWSESPLMFTARGYMDTFFWLWCSGLSNHTRGTLIAVIPQILRSHTWVWDQPVCISPFLTRLDGVSSVNPWL